MKDYDSQDRLIRIRALGYAAVGGFIGFGMVIGWGQGSLLKAVIVGIGSAVAAYAIPIFLMNRAAQIGGSIIIPAGNTTPAIRQYSLADSLVARGKYAEAAEAYMLAAEEFPDDPQPPLRAARTLRDHMKLFDDAAEWFKKALAVKGIEQSVEIATVRELAEVYTHKLKAPNRALPFLARLAQKYPDHPAGKWAREEVAEIKQTMLQERNDTETRGSNADT